MNVTYAHDSIQVKVLRYIEELLKGRALSARPVDTILVCLNMGLEDPKAKDEVAQAMSELLAEGYILGKELRGDSQAMDVTVTAITEKGFQLLQGRLT
jgi:hypothetical protein